MASFSWLMLIIINYYSNIMNENFKFKMIIQNCKTLKLSYEMITLFYLIFSATWNLILESQKCKGKDRKFKTKKSYIRSFIHMSLKTLFKNNFCFQSILKAPLFNTFFSLVHVHFES